MCLEYSCRNSKCKKHIMLCLHILKQILIGFLPKSEEFLGSFAQIL